MTALYDKSILKNETMLFTGKQIRHLLIPIILEQILNACMGMADTMMVSRVGSEAISAVSLVDSINKFILMFFAAMATGAVIICSQYIGDRNPEKANDAAGQVVLSVGFISLILTLISIIFNRQLLEVIFGSVEPGVMRASRTYFYVTALSFPFIALFNAGSAFYRAGRNSRFPMNISIISNVINIIGNAILIFVFHLGVFGAALSTLISRIFCMLVIFLYLRKPGQLIVVRNYLKLRPNWKMIGKIMSVGLPSGIENGMFSFGKLAIQSSVSLLGTTAIAAQAMTIMFEDLSSYPGLGVGAGMMTVIGQCIGAGKTEQAKYYNIKLTKIGYLTVTLTCLVLFLVSRPVMTLAGLNPESAAMCFRMLIFITVMKPVIWSVSFVMPHGFRAAGDVRYTMIVSTIVMWGCRVVLATVLIRAFGFGPMAVWIGQISDWWVRGVIYIFRLRSGKWLKDKLV